MPSKVRNDEIEAHLREIPHPVVVDCGVNIGITVRWWHYLNPCVRVYGFDMMDEAHAFTQSRIGEAPIWYCPITCALSGRDGLEIEISYDDPLFGENSVSTTNRRHRRIVQTGTIDTQLSMRGVTTVDVLKIDIEGHGAEALKGATQTLQATRFVIFETHTSAEMNVASTILHDSGFALVAMRNRTLIYERPHNQQLRKSQDDNIK